MNEPLHFKTRNEFRIWLMNHCMSGDGVWLKFEKSKNTAFKAGDALEEALCFGWIDGVMKRIDDESYIKYFSASALFFSDHLLSFLRAEKYLI